MQSWFRTLKTIRTFRTCPAGQTDARCLVSSGLMGSPDGRWSISGDGFYDPAKETVLVLIEVGYIHKSHLWIDYGTLIVDLCDIIDR